MSRREIDAIIAAANPVREEEIATPTLEQVDRKLHDAIARERNTALYEEPRKRSPRRGPGFMVVIFATLALAGGALAAVGVWHPLGGGGGHRPVERFAPEEAPAGTQSDFMHGAPASRGSRSAERHSEGAAAAPGSAADLSAFGPVEAPPGKSAVEQVPGDPSAPTGVHGANPTSSEPSGVDEGQKVEAPPRVPPAPPSPPEPPTPQPSSTSVGCGQISATMLRCSVSVRGEAGAPTGQVSFELLEPSGSVGRFSPSSCSLIETNGVDRSLCQVEYGPLLPAHLAVAHYGGDANYLPSSATFEL
jgi:hypothetical protein